jgi:DNA repair protein RadA/Sms
MVVGEIGLTGEVRPINRLAERLREGVKMGFERCVVPGGNLGKGFTETAGDIKGKLDIIGVSTIEEAISLVLMK